MNYFNNNTTQVIATAFMDIFSKISIEKYQTVSVSGEDFYVQRKVIPVPCQWATREKFIEIIRSSSARRAMNPSLNNAVEMQWILPRISVNLTGLTYDPSRRLAKTQKVDSVANALGSTTDSAYSPTPYNLNFEVATISRNIDENFQIMEQILPFFSPTMNLNIILPNGTESIPITLASVSPDNPTDIPENDERFFTTTYNFTVKMNYFLPKKTSNIINNIEVKFINGQEVLQISKEYITSLNIIQDKFNMYVDNSTNPNPLTSTQIITPSSIPSTYSNVEYGSGQESDLITNILNALGYPGIVPIINGTTMILDTPSISGSNNQYKKYIGIHYRLDNNPIIYNYTNPIDITFSKIYYWIDISTKTDNKQLDVHTFEVIP